MIKFFSKIRHKTIADNNSFKYLKYAIGEIILVVIGILLALGINNWNNERQLKDNNKVFLNKMLKDLDANEKRLGRLVFESLGNGSYPSLESAVKASDSILKLSYPGFNDSHINFISTSRFSAGNSLLNLNDNIFSELSNTGKLYSVGSDSVVEAIKAYYKRVDREVIYNNINADVVREGFDKFEDGFGKLLMDYRKDSLILNLKNYSYYNDKNSKEYNDFQIGISKIWSGQLQNMRKMKELIVETNKLKDIIKNELQND